MSYRGYYIENRKFPVIVLNSNLEEDAYCDSVTEAKETVDEFVENNAWHNCKYMVICKSIK